MTSRTELRAHLDELRWERALAKECGLGDCPDYMSDLECEIAECLQALTLTTVSEIASLHGAVFGVQVG